MVELKDDICKLVSERIRDYSRKEMLAAAAALLTLPRLSANSVRCETLVHLAATYSQGKQKPNRTVFQDTLNSLLGGSHIAMLEDPQEDVFVSNISTAYGDLRVINALWEANDYFIQVLIDIVTNTEVPADLIAPKDSCIALLKLSEEIVRRAGLSRNDWAASVDKETISIPRTEDLDSISKRVLFTEEDLYAIGVAVESITPFIISEEELFSLRSATIGNSILEEKPIVRAQKHYVVSLPNAIGVAVRKLFLRACRKNGSIKAFSQLLHNYQADQLFNDVLREYRSGYTSVDPEIEKIPFLPNMHTLLLRDDSGCYLHVIFLHDDIDGILDQGMDSFHKLTDDQLSALSRYIFSVAAFCETQNNFKSGIVLTCHGGLGRGYGVGFNNWPDGWGFSALSLNDLMLLSGAESRPLKDMFQCLKQKWWAEDKGLKFSNPNGDLNYLGFWNDSNYKCVPNEIAIEKNSMISLYTDFIFPVRRNLRIESDKHGVLNTDGQWYRVERLTKDSFYEGMRLRPIYASKDHLKNGRLTGLVESNILNVWLEISTFSENISRRVVFEWWSGFIHAIDEAMSFISNKVDIKSNLTIQISLDLSQLFAVNSFDMDSNELTGIITTFDHLTLNLFFEPNFMANFSKPENRGEKKVLSAILNGIAAFLKDRDFEISQYIEPALHQVLGDIGVRFIHIFRTFDPVDWLLHSASGDARFVDKKQEVFELIKICAAITVADQEIVGRRDCGNVLNQIVDEVWFRIRAILKPLERRSFLLKVITLLGAIEQDRGQWSRTAKAVKAIYSKYDDVVMVAQQRESDRSLSSLCLRALIEMSICECSDGGMEASDDVLDELLSLCALLVNTASSSDAIHWGLVQPSINFYKNGTYSIPTDVWDEVIFPYIYGYFQIQFEEDVTSYGDLYESNEIVKASIKKEVFGAEFDEALIAEFGLPADQIVECMAEIIDMHIESSEPIIQISSDDLVKRIVGNRGCTTDIVALFLNAFSLYARPTWDSPPEGYVFRDIAPWKYKRRLSCLVKPIIRMSNGDLILSVLLIKNGMSYFLSHAKDGEFNTEFFRSDRMRSYVGTMVEKRGAEFTNQVAAKLESAGWLVDKEVLMTKLGAPPELGDIDVLAIKNDTLLVIECKNLQMAKTASEIADVCNRFRGEEKDELRKHLNRVHWVSNNIDSVKQSIRCNSGVSNISGILLTNTELPIRYKKDLPIDSENIVSFRKIDDWLALQ